MSLTAAVGKDGLIELFCESQPVSAGQTGQVYHIKQDPSKPLQWWENKDGSPNWLTLGVPSNS